MDEERSWTKLSEEERLAYEIVEKVATAFNVPIGTSMRKAREITVELLKQHKDHPLGSSAGSPDAAEEI